MHFDQVIKTYGWMLNNDNLLNLLELTLEDYENNKPNINHLRITQNGDVNIVIALTKEGKYKFIMITYMQFKIDELHFIATVTNTEIVEIVKSFIKKITIGDEDV